MPPRLSGATGDRAVVVLGIGNSLMRDEGVGVHVVNALAGAALPPGVELVDGGTLGIELLPIVERAGSIVLVDAAGIGGVAGGFRALRGKDLEVSYGGHVSPHQAGAADLIAVARLTGALPERCTLFAVQPGELGFGLELSEAVAGALPAILEAVLDEAAAFTLETSDA